MVLAKLAVAEFRLMRRDRKRLLTELAGMDCYGQIEAIRTLCQAHGIKTKEDREEKGDRQRKNGKTSMREPRII
jgi:hypothetical protein